MSWIVPAALGAYHGLNPAMGWLFAVALGLQERRSGAVLRALPPIALGHAASVATIILAAAGASAIVPAPALRTAGAILLLGFAGLLLVRPIHPRWVGMRLGPRGLTGWSFVMSSAHGAGLMLLPMLIPATAGSAHMAHGHAAPAILTLAIHTAAMFGAMTVASLLVYHVLGVSFLRRAWINTEMLWAGALAASGLVLLVIR